MIRKGFVGLAGAVVAAVLVGQAAIAAQNTAAPKAPAKSADQKAAPAAPPATPPATPAKSQSSTASSGSGQAVPATTPTQQPTQGAAEDPKVTASTIGSVHIPKKVMADGKPLAAGTYTLRLTDQMGAPVKGQTTSQERWVEFVQGGQVKGRELATVLPAAEAKTIAKQGVPSAGGSKIQTLVGNEYLRVWINKGGTNYIVHLPNG
jgi:cytoskeletal protein RodZ